MQEALDRRSNDDGNFLRFEAERIRWAVHSDGQAKTSAS